MHAAALAPLRRLAAADPPLLLRCSALPLLVHAAAQRAYHAHASEQRPGPRWAAHEAGAVRQLQDGVGALLRAARQEAAAAGAAVAAMWPLWEQQPPAPLAGEPPLPPAGSAAPVDATHWHGPAGGPLPWDRLTAAGAGVAASHATRAPAAARRGAAAAAQFGGNAAGLAGPYALDAATLVDMLA